MNRLVLQCGAQWCCMHSAVSAAVMHTMSTIVTAVHNGHTLATVAVHNSGLPPFKMISCVLSLFNSPPPPPPAQYNYLNMQVRQLRPGYFYVGYCGTLPAVCSLKTAAFFARTKHKAVIELNSAKAELCAPAAATSWELCWM